MSENREQKKEQQKEKKNNSSYNNYICIEVVSSFSIINSVPNLFQNYPADSKSNKSNDPKADPSKAFENTVQAINNLTLKLDKTITSINNSIKSQNESNSSLASKFNKLWILLINTLKVKIIQMIIFLINLTKLRLMLLL